MNQAEMTLAAARAMRERIEEDLHDLVTSARGFVAQWFEADEEDRSTIEMARAQAVDLARGKVALLAEATRREVLEDLALAWQQADAIVSEKAALVRKLNPLETRLIARQRELGQLESVARIQERAHVEVSQENRDARAEIRAEVREYEAQVDPLKVERDALDACAGALENAIKDRYDTDVLLRPGAVDKRLGNAGWCAATAARVAREKAHEALEALVEAGLELDTGYRIPLAS